jgi:hypothetical protein
MWPLTCARLCVRCRTSVCAIRCAPAAIHPARRLRRLEHKRRVRKDVALDCPGDPSRLQLAHRSPVAVPASRCTHAQIVSLQVLLVLSRPRRGLCWALRRQVRSLRCAAGSAPWRAAPRMPLPAAIARASPRALRREPRPSSRRSIAPRASQMHRLRCSQPQWNCCRSYRATDCVRLARARLCLLPL